MDLRLGPALAQAGITKASPLLALGFGFLFVAVGLTLRFLSRSPGGQRLITPWHPTREGSSLTRFQSFFRWHTFVMVFIGVVLAFIGGIRMLV